MSKYIIQPHWGNFLRKPKLNRIERIKKKAQKLIFLKRDDNI